MPEVSLADWQTFVRARPKIHLLQTGEWGELKSAFGWSAIHLISDTCGVQILFRKLPFGLTIAYIPKASSENGQWSMVDGLRGEIDSACKRRRAIFCKIEFDVWEGELPAMVDDPRAMVSPDNIQPPRTIVIDMKGNFRLVNKSMPLCRY